MNQFFKLFLILLPVIGCGKLYAQKHGQAAIDSMLQELPRQKEDTNKVKLLINVSNTYNKINPDTGIKFGQQSMELSTKLEWKKGMAMANNCIGVNYFNKSDFPKALAFLEKALKFDEGIENKDGIANVTTNIGLVLESQSDYPKALQYDFKALKMLEEIGDKQSIALVNGNIGIVYMDQSNYPKALEYYFKALKMNEESGNKSGVASVTVNIGSVYREQKEYSKTLECYFNALKIYEELGAKEGIAIAAANIGATYAEQKYYIEAIEYDQKALKVFEETGNKMHIASGLANLGVCFLLIVTDTSAKPNGPNTNEHIVSRNELTNQIPAGKKARVNKAIYFLQRSLAIYKEIHSPDDMKTCYGDLSEAYKLSGDYKKSLECFENYTAIKDSVFSADNDKKVLQIGMEGEYQRRRMADSLVTMTEQKTAALKLQKQKSFTYIGLAGILLLSGFSFFIFKNNKLLNKEKQKTEHLLGEVQIKNKEITIKNKEITDNINYAQRIQSAILPDINLVHKTLEQTFILYLPKDIVSGDFYAFAEKNGQTIIVAADSTGHGVTGAFMSMIGSSLLNQIINERGIVQPATILNQLNKLVIESLKQSENDSNDGMDMSICTFDLNNNNLQYAGANRPLWLLRNNTIEEYKPDKLPIGGLQAARDRSFTNFEISLQKNDAIYLFTDGFADQFGGENGKKLMTARFKEILLSIQSLTMHEQEIKLKNYFETWKGNNEQVDDVLVIGVRV